MKSISQRGIFTVTQTLHDRYQKITRIKFTVDNGRILLNSQKSNTFRADHRTNSILIPSEAETVKLPKHES